MNRLRRLLRRTTGALSRLTPDSTEYVDGDIDSDADAEYDDTRSEVDLLFDEGMTARSYLYHRVEAADGRVRQQRLVEESRLPESTVSRLLSEFESEGHLERRRIGRENVVFLPGREPTDFDPERASASAGDGHRGVPERAE